MRLNPARNSLPVALYSAILIYARSSLQMVWLNFAQSSQSQFQESIVPRVSLVTHVTPTSRKQSAKHKASHCHMQSAKLLENGVVRSVSWSAGRCFAIQLSKIKLAHSSATFQVRKHTFKASVACNGREVLHGTPEGRHGISAIEAADCLGNREPTIHWKVSRTSAACREGPENTSRPALCGASPWGGFPESK